MSDNSQQSRLKELISRGKEQGYLTYSEVNDHLPEDIADPDQVEDIIRMINDMGIQVCETAPDADSLLMQDNDSADEAAAAEAAAVLAAVESDVGRTTDPVRMYMREMGTVELLTREGEIQIAKRIEEGIRDVMAALAHFPGAVDNTIANYDRIVSSTEEEGAGRLSDVVTGFVDRMRASLSSPVTTTMMESCRWKREKISTARKTRAGNDDDDEDEDGDSSSTDEETESGPDPEEAKRRFDELRAAMDLANALIAKHGRNSKEVHEALAAVGNLFTPSTDPRHFDGLINHVREVNDQIRGYERQIMTICTKDCKCPEVLHQVIPGNENQSRLGSNPRGCRQRLFCCGGGTPGRAETSAEEFLSWKSRAAYPWWT